MATNYVWRDGSRLTVWMLYIINMLDGDLFRLFGVHVIVTSAIRLHQEQIDIFLSRYVTAGNVRGRPVYDTRVWNSTRYYRISRLGTVAVPGTSNHEIQGDSAAVDIRDTGSDAGITNRNSARGRWLRANAARYGLVAEGDGFGEGWHFKVLGIFRTPPGGSPAPGTSTPQEDPQMLMLRINGVARQHYVALGEGATFRHFIQTDPYTRIMQIERSADDWQDIHIGELPAFLRTNGCDLSIWDFRDPATGKSIPGTDPKAQFMVLDPLTGTVAPGNMWSAANAARAADNARALEAEKRDRELLVHLQAVETQNKAIEAQNKAIQGMLSQLLSAK